MTNVISDDGICWSFDGVSVSRDYETDVDGIGFLVDLAQEFLSILHLKFNCVYRPQGVLFLMRMILFNINVEFVRQVGLLGFYVLEYIL